jgi:zinc D-Ala-D-Ala carboxypeptidase
MDTSMQLSKNLTLKEVIKSETAIRLGINNVPNDKQLENLKTVATEVFQKIRDYFGVPIKVASGFRCEALNKAVKGSKTSDHMTGSALDIDVDGFNYIDNKAIFNYVKDHLEFKQLIWEFGDSNNPDWVHVAYVKGQNKKEVLRAIRKAGKTIYVPYVE